MSMNKLHYIPNCWHEQIANIYNLELVTENADILILRDPFDRAIEQTMDFLDSGGDSKGKTFEELVFEERNIITKSLKIQTNETKELVEKNYKFIGFINYITWNPTVGSLYPKEQIMNHEDFTLESLAKGLSKHVDLYKKIKTDYGSLNFNTRFKSNELDTALRGDYQVANSMDYNFLRKCKRKVQTGMYNDK
tara:strand:- start:5810 stop:6388 length:579 start_codon:yes stop_codon:yes gene_type:complete